MRRLSWETFEARYGELVREACARYAHDPALLAGLIMQESGGHTGARSHVGAYGLTQVMPATAKCYGYNLSTPRGQIEAGADYLARCLRHRNVRGNIEKALAAYNGGWGNVGKWVRKARKIGDGRSWRSYAFRETREYIPRVLKYAEQYRAYLARVWRPVDPPRVPEKKSEPTFLPAEPKKPKKKRRLGWRPFYWLKCRLQGR